MDKAFRVGEDVSVLPGRMEAPGVGVIPVNAFVIHAEEPVLVDTGLGFDGPEFLDELRAVVDPADLRWIWITHDDADHIGNLEAVLEVAPNARLATHAFSALRMGSWLPVPLDRVHAIGPGARLDVGDRTLTALRPPTYDNPMSLAIYDERTSTLFSVDSFGAILPRHVEVLDDLSEDELVGGMVIWTTFDSPWAHLADHGRFAGALDAFRQLAPEQVFSSHLPPATGRLESLLAVVASIPEAEPFVPPDAAAFAEIVAALGD
jgi:hypothetical protein